LINLPPRQYLPAWLHHGEEDCNDTDYDEEQTAKRKVDGVFLKEGESKEAIFGTPGRTEILRAVSTVSDDDGDGHVASGCR
jgi:hypothetical protein